MLLEAATGRAWCANVGDSRAAILRCKKGKGKKEKGTIGIVTHPRRPFFYHIAVMLILWPFFQIPLTEDHDAENKSEVHIQYQLIHRTYFVIYCNILATQTLSIGT